jgi:small-conductance mechanosensitive channel
MIVIAPLAVLAMLLFAFIGGEVVKLLWNWLTPTVFGWRTITFWQAFGLLALCRILFGGRHFSVPRSTARQRIRQRMAERWEKMSPEERERWRQSLRGRCSSFEPPDSQPTA